MNAKDKKVQLRCAKGKPPQYMVNLRSNLNANILDLAHKINEGTPGTKQYDGMKEKLNTLAPFYLKHIVLDTQKDIAKLRANTEDNKTKAMFFALMKQSDAPIDQVTETTHEAIDVTPDSDID